MSRTKLLAATALALAAAVTPATAEPVVVGTPDRVCPPHTSTVTLACFDLLASVTAELSPSGTGAYELIPTCRVTRLGNQAVLTATVDTFWPGAVTLDVHCEFNYPGAGHNVRARGTTTAGKSETVNVPAGVTIRACMVSTYGKWSDGTEVHRFGCTPS
jgi:hypothetical protein